MVELGLKLEELLKKKGLENEKLRSFENQVKKETEGLQNSANHKTINNPVDTRKEIGNFANTSHDTVMKVKKIKEKAPDEAIQKLRDSEISINQVYTTIKREEKEHGNTRESIKEQVKGNSYLSLDDKPTDQKIAIQKKRMA